jgi:hypothetical protein
MKKNYLTGYKLVFGLLGFSAIITEMVALIERGVFNAGNFFSYFTIESNILAVVAFLAGALAIYAGRKSVWLDYFRGAVTFFMVVTGIVFSLLLSGLEGVQLTAVPWDNIVLHYIIPIAIVIDWLMDRPARRFSFRQALAWMIFPILYLVYSLARGAIVNWYPYPFLNPANGGYNQVLLTSLIIAVGGLLLVYVVSSVGKTRTVLKK